MYIETIERKRRFGQAKAIHPTFGALFQNEMGLTIGMIDQEFDQIEAFEMEIALYKDQLNQLKAKIGT